MKFPVLAALFVLFAPLPSLATDADADDIARSYVKLVLALGNHDKNYVDAYYGPDEWSEQVKKENLPVDEIIRRARDLRRTLPHGEEGDSMDALRLQYLGVQLDSLAAFGESLQEGYKRDFDTEARGFYDSTPPRRSHAEFDPVLAELDQMLPGSGPLYRRVDRFLKAYEIPQGKLEAVFDAAIDACRERTRKHIQLLPDESFSLEYVEDKPWSAYNWYKGGGHSLIQVNTSLPIRIDRAIDLGCHEGYPGHHTYLASLEQALVNERGWVEFSVSPLFSPQSLISEGSANYGIELAFPGDEKIAYEMKVLYPLAGLDPASAGKYEQVQELTRKLAFARNETARLYVNGDINREQAIALSQKYGPSSRERAEQSVRFIDTYGAYVINYNWGKQLVKEYIESDTNSGEERWRKFADLLASPRPPSALAAGSR